jgi:uncharacterized membrane protein
LRKLAAICLVVTWIAGAMRWLGGSSRSWMMYSPKSVSTGSMPWRARCSLMAISSPIIDLPLVTVRAPALRQISRTMSCAASASTAQCT